jgi:flagellar hook-associated protein 3 FlgL
MSSFVSTASISNAMRYSLLRAQTQLTQAQKEVSTGVVADVGLALGARTGQSLSFSRDLDRLKAIVDTNGLAASRLSSTQDALGQISTAAQNFLKTLTTSIDGDAAPSITYTDANNLLQSLTSILNTSYNGEHLFAGINTDVQPINDFTATGSPNKAAFDAAFQTYFGFTQSDPLAANITAAQMDDFITTAVEPQFLGAGWQANWSNATDEGITSRIALNETVETSVSANDVGLRKLAMVAATVTDLLDPSSQVGEAARKTLFTRAADQLGEAIADIANLSSRTGIVENRVQNATDRINMQSDLFEKNIQGLEGVDPYEASTRVSTLMQQIETSYALTARIQELSLVNYLPTT